MSLPEHYSTSRVIEQPGRGFVRLRFSGFVEEQFRQYYAELQYATVRPLIVLVAAAVIGVTLVGIYQYNISVPTAAFGLAIMLPLLIATLIVSYQSGKQAIYQRLLAVSVFCIGLIVDSLTLRASLHGTPYYFGGEIAWVFIVWLVLGMTFWYAAVTAVTISMAYAWGLLHWQFDPHQVLFESLMLLGVNAIGALCCFHYEAGTRDAFSKKRDLEDQAHRDGLTGLHNRRVYNEYMGRIWRQSQREQTQIAIMLIDIDCFKAFNDLYGHQAGDDALKRVAEVIDAGAQRPLDFAARYGGEEFALVLYGANSDLARKLAEQIRHKVEALAIPHGHSVAGERLSVSIGVAIILPAGTERNLSGAEHGLAGAVQMADEALYQAKEEGRNRLVIKESHLTQIEAGRFRGTRKSVG